MVNKCFSHGFSLSAVTLFALLSLSPGMAGAQEHGLAMHGTPKFSPDFAKVDYVNPDAPKGGTLRLSVLGSFDSLNPFVIKGAPAWGPMVSHNRYLKNLVHESLLRRSSDEPFTLYGLLAETVKMAPDRSWVRFTLNPDARFSDGEPVTVEDVLFSWKSLKEMGRPNHRLYYGMVEKAEVTGEREVTFTFKPGGNAELPLLMGLMAVLPAHAFAERAFDSATLAPIPGSGPYVVSMVDAGRKVTFTRNPDYWGKDLPVNRGLYNFDTVSLEFYRDGTSELEAFKAGGTDFRQENDPRRWQELEALAADGQLSLAEIPNGWPAPMRGLVFNTRKAIFDDPLVREALSLAFDFEWVNTNFFHGAYARTEGYFDGSALAAEGPAGAEELSLIKELDLAGREELVSPPPSLPEAADQRALRSNLRQATKLLRQAGWHVEDNQLVNDETGEPFVFDILIGAPIDERLALHFAANLERLGIEARVETTDTASYQARLDDYDFDMIVYRWDLSLSPGNELAFYFGSDAAETPGTRNYMGVQDPAIDALIERIVSATDRNSLVTAARVLDRVLRTGLYVIPLYHAEAEWLAYRNLARPEMAPLEGYILEAWWAEKK